MSEEREDGRPKTEDGKTMFEEWEWKICENLWETISLVEIEIPIFTQ